MDAHWNLVLALVTGLLLGVFFFGGAVVDDPEGSFLQASGGFVLRQFVLENGLSPRWISSRVWSQVGASPDFSSRFSDGSLDREVFYRNNRAASLHGEGVRPCTSVQMRRFFGSMGH